MQTFRDLPLPPSPSGQRLYEAGRALVGEGLLPAQVMSNSFAVHTAVAEGVGLLVVSQRVD